tara:strand:+ start:374 stop:667 length:294 start_codon:yes stop_codon:yes gene_type:complete
MPVTVVTTFIKSDASTDDYANPEVKAVLDDYESSNKITDRQSSRSKDGLTQERTRVFADQESFDAFRAEDAIIKNKAIREKWCEDNNVRMMRSVVSK